MRRLKQIKCSEKGDIAIEALLGLIVFILGVMAVLMFSMLMRLEASTQYAVDQVAKEVSQYYYVVEKTGILPDSPQQSPSPDGLEQTLADGKTVKEKAENAIQDFQSLAGSASSGDFENIFHQVEQSGNSAQEAVSAAKSLKNSLTTTNWNEQLGILLNLTVRSGVNRLVGCLIADPVCSMLFPKYISASDLDAYLKANGIEDGMDGMHFEQSTFLADGYTINVVLNYKVNLKALTFGMYDGDVYVQQTACTAAWIHYKGNSTENLKNLFSLWDVQGQGVRGQKIVQYFEQKGDYGLSIKNGTGFDMYDESNHTLTKIKSIHFFDSKVTTKNEDGSYTLHEDVLKKRISQYMNEMYNEGEMKAKKKGTVTMEGSGEEKTLDEDTKYQMIIVVPEDAKQFSSDVDAIVAELITEKDLEKNGYQVKIVYDQCEVSQEENVGTESSIK